MTETTLPNAIVFIDATLADQSTLVANLPPGTEIHYLDPNQDGIAQMAAALTNRTGISAIHLFSHGSEGQVNLGSTVLNAANSHSYASELATIGAALAEGGDWLLYGCNVARGTKGFAFIQQLAALTGADVAASDDLTGSSVMGGNWLLEASTGTIDIASLNPANYQHLLDVINGSDISETLDGTANNDSIYGFGGNDTLNGNGGDDLLDGGEGYDYLYGGSGNDELIGGLSTDTTGNNLQGQDGDDILTGTAGADNMYGGEGSDRYDGGDGNDYINDSEGNSALTSNVINAGAGDDRIRVYSYNVDSKTKVTGGTGQDTYELLNYSNSKLLITDFAAGAGGDVLDVASLLDQSTGYEGGNPFNASLSYMRFKTNGSDTLLQWDRDGMATSYDWKTVVSLKNTNSADLTAENFSPLIPPDGSSTGLNLTGTDNSETLKGGVVDDTISGLGGNDTLYGYGGNDKLLGGEGYDYLYGGVGNDNLIGGTATDTTGNYLNGEAGNDRLTGSGGDENLYGGYGSDNVQGRGGNDLLSDEEYDSAVTKNVLKGGAGDDEFRVFSYNPESKTFATGGSGRDTFEINAGSSGQLTITDFKTGVGGDIFDVGNLLDRSDNYASGNPFDGNLSYLRFVSSGNLTLLQWDEDGKGLSYDWKTVAQLQKFNAANLVGENFIPFIPLDGSTTGLNLTASPAGGFLHGSVYKDSLTGLEGNDTLYGYGGNDNLNGGAGYDYLYGGAGNDVIIGGDAADTSGNQFYGENGNDRLIGTAGNEYLYGSSGNDTLKGGDGNDYLSDEEYDSLLSKNTLDGGAGNDNIRVFSYNPESLTRATGGSGSDSYQLQSGSRGDLAITDFTVGTGGDILDIASLISSSIELSAANPLAGGVGYFRLAQQGNDTLLQWDRDGAGTSYGWESKARLLKITADSLTSDNFNPSSDVSSIDIITNHLPTGKVAILGEAFVGQTLTASNTLSDADGLGTLRYEWYVGDNSYASSTGDTYTIRSGDLGETIKVRIVYTDSQGTIERVTSKPTGNIDDFAASASTLGTISPGGQATGVIQSIGDSDWFKVNLTAASYYEFELNGQDSADGTLPDPFLQLFDARGNLLAANDDSANLNAKIAFTANKSGTYYLAASASANETGSYHLAALSFGAASEKHIGTKNDDTLTGGDGNDLLDGRKGADTMTGGLGNDSYYVDNNGDQTIETANAGKDTVFSSITHTLAANVEKLVLLGTDAIDGIGNGLSNTITGNEAANTLNGKSGADILLGGLGNDLYIVDHGRDNVIEFSGQGKDTVRSTVSFTLPANVENLQLLGTRSIKGIGNNQANDLVGNKGANQLLGNAGNDSLNGGAGKDVLIGGTGKDTMTGGKGADRFGFDSILDSKLTKATRDTITDFKAAQGDKIDLSGIDAKANSAADNAFTFIGNAAFSATNATGQLRFDSASHILYGSTDADNNAEFSILLTGVNNLAEANIIL